MNGKESSTKFNYGIALLKVILSFVVVMCHFYTGTGITAYPEKIAVPTFIALTFFFAENSFREKGRRISLKNITRLLIPGIFWGGVYYVASLVMHNGATLKDLVLQLLLGSDHLINPTLWYLYDTAFVLLVFGLIQRLTNDKAYMGMRVILLLAGVVLQYTGLNYQWFSTLSQDIVYSIGRLAENIPAACIGSFLSDLTATQGNRYRVLNKCSGIPVLVLTIGIYFALYFVHIPSGSGFGYQGLSILLGCILLITGFYYFDVPMILHRIISYIQQYGLGIYSVHMAVGKTLELTLKKIGLSSVSLLFCLLVWLLCIVACSIFDLITRKKLRVMIS